MPKPMNPKTVSRHLNIFAQGHTPEDISKVLPDISRRCALHLVQVWAFNDFYGCGGDSQLCVLKDGKFYNCPQVIVDFLYEGVDADLATGANRWFPLDRLAGRRPQHQINKHNWAYRNNPAKALS